MNIINNSGSEPTMTVVEAINKRSFSTNDGYYYVQNLTVTTRDPMVQEIWFSRPNGSSTTPTVTYCIYIGVIVV